MFRRLNLASERVGQVTFTRLWWYLCCWRWKWGRNTYSAGLDGECCWWSLRLWTLKDRWAETVDGKCFFRLKEGNEYDCFESWQDDFPEHRKYIDTQVQENTYHLEASVAMTVNPGQQILITISLLCWRADKYSTYWLSGLRYMIYRIWPEYYIFNLLEHGHWRSGVIHKRGKCRMYTNPNSLQPTGKPEKLNLVDTVHFSSIYTLLKYRGTEDNRPSDLSALHTKMSMQRLPSTKLMWTSYCKSGANIHQQMKGIA